MPSVFRTAQLLLAGILVAISITAATAARDGPGLPILVYHRILGNGEDLGDEATGISVERFESEMRLLHENGYATLSTDQVIDLVSGRGAMPTKKIVAIHFDDGWKSAQFALPVLERYGFRAAFWIIAGSGIGWPHMDWEELRALARNPRYEVLSHTMSHPWKDGETLLDWVNGRVPGKGLKEVRWELEESRRLLIEKFGRPVTALAWPRGLYNDTLVRLATEAGYRALFTINDGLNHRGGDLLRIHRIMIHGGCNDDVFTQILIDGRYRDCP